MGEVRKLKGKVLQLQEWEGDHLHLLQKQQNMNANLIASEAQTRERLAEQKERYAASQKK